MGNNTEYFNRIGYRPKYQIGDRVYGRWNKIPFTGSVGNDTVINETEGPRVSIHLDLPIRINNYNHTVIFVKHRDIKQLLKEI